MLGLVTLENFKFSFNQVLDQRSKQILGADFSVSARRQLKGDEINYLESNLPKATKVANTTALFSMVAGTGYSRLVYLRAIEYGFPFFGHLKLREKGLYPKNVPFDSFLKPNSVWVYPELLIQLNSKVGDTLKIGNKNFIIDDVIDEDTQQTFQMGSIASRIYLSQEGIKRTELIQKGSTVWYGNYYQFTDGLDLEKLQETTRENLPDAGLWITSPKKAGQQVGRVLNYLNDFLGLVSLVALFLASVGLFYLFRSYLKIKRKDFAILNSLGMVWNDIFKLSLWHLAILGFSGSVLGLLISYALIPLTNYLVSFYLPFQLPFQINASSLIIAFGVGTVGNILLGLPLLFSQHENPIDLFQEEFTKTSKEQMKGWMWFLPWVIFYFLLAIYISNSIIIASLFLGLFLGIGILIYPLGLYLLGKISNLTSPKLYLSLAVKNMARFRFSTLSIFISLTLGAMLLTLIPQLHNNLEDELQTPSDGKAPSFFLFDIQEEQVSKLKAYLSSKDVELLGVSPMVQARIQDINGKEFKISTTGRPLTREEEREQRSRNRSINLTYRKGLSDTEELVEGTPFSGRYGGNGDEVAEISVERRYAKRLNLGLGDVLTFDVLGLLVKGKVVNIRRVRWTSFLPNFFIVFQPGVLEEAPKTFLAAIPQLNLDQRTLLPMDMFKDFPNVSMVDLTRVIKRVLLLIKQMGWALRIMAILSLLVGLLVIYSLVGHQVLDRRKDIVLLKMLGISFSDLNKTILLEFFILGFGASLMGISLGLGVSYIVSMLFFDSLWSFRPLLPLGLLVTVTGLSLLVSYLATFRVLRSRVGEWLYQN
jgi:putative ABC transport system permease protein